MKENVKVKLKENVTLEEFEFATFGDVGNDCDYIDLDAMKTKGTTGILTIIDNEAVELNVLIIHNDEGHEKLEFDYGKENGIDIWEYERE